MRRDWPSKGWDGVRVYLVGGAVRDSLLDLPFEERDWVVVGATPQQMLERGFRPADAAFPVFLHPGTGEEYALARTEVKTGPGYKGFSTEAGPDVTLEQDLLRRDLTINALAMDEAGNLIDVCGGREDLDKGVLRHITSAFTEDPVRLLRVARFAAKLGRWGFRVAHPTHKLMKEMAASADLASLKPERVWLEMTRAMAEVQPWRFFEVLHRCAALAGLMPSLDRLMGTPAGHRSDNVPGVLAGLKRAVGLTDDPVVRTAVVLYEAAASESDPGAWIRSLKAGREESRLVEDLVSRREGLALSEDAGTLLRLVEGFKPRQQATRYRRFLLAARALWPEVMAQRERGLAEAVDLLGARAPEQLYRELRGEALGRALAQWRVAQLERRLGTGSGDSAESKGS